MIIIADTSPLSYLICIQHVEVLPQLYRRILIPPAVLAELNHPRAPEAVRAWMSQPAAWLIIQAPRITPDASLIEANLGLGEREAILLAQELGADQLIIDELRGRKEAARRNIRITGTIGILRAAARLGLVDLIEAFDRLRRTNFHIAEEVLQRLIQEDKA